MKSGNRMPAASSVIRWTRALVPKPIRGSAVGAESQRTRRATTACRTVPPGSYTGEDGAPRCPHINVMILAIGLTRRLVTTIFFADEPAGVSDPVLNYVPESGRPRLFAARDASLDSEGVAGYHFDLILRGENETPFFLD